MPDFKKIFNLDYLINSDPGANFKYLPHFMIFFAVLMGLALIIGLLRRPTNFLIRRQKARIARMLWTCSGVGLVLLFSRWQNLSFLDRRIFLFGLGWLIIVWGIYMIIYTVMILPKQLRHYQKQIEYNKYLPRRR